MTSYLPQCRWIRLEPSVYLTRRQGLPEGRVRDRLHVPHVSPKRPIPRLLRAELIIPSLYARSIIFIVIFLLDLFLVGAGSSGAVPFGTILAVIGLWFLISTPLNVAGTYYGIRHGVSTDPSLSDQA